MHESVKNLNLETFPLLWNKILTSFKHCLCIICVYTEALIFAYTEALICVYTETIICVYTETIICVYTEALIFVYTEALIFVYTEALICVYTETIICVYTETIICVYTEALICVYTEELIPVHYLFVIRGNHHKKFLQLSLWKKVSKIKYPLPYLLLLFISHALCTVHPYQHEWIHPAER
jgi:hypothetical protein